MRLGYSHEMLSCYISKVRDIRDGCPDQETRSMLTTMISQMEKVRPHISGAPTDHVIIRTYNHCRVFASAINGLYRLDPKLLKQSLFHWIGPLTDQIFRMEAHLAGQ